MKELIDITTTATLRPEILDDTYQSFWTNLFEKYKDKYHYRLIINIDPIGDDRYDYKDVLNVAKKYFSDIIYNSPKTHQWPHAFKWVWKQTTSKYVFNLEDMWISMTEVDLEDLIYIIDEYPKIAWVHLHKYVLADGSPDPFFYHAYKSEKDKKLFIEVEKPTASPGLFRGEFVRKMSELMNDEISLELQLWGDHYKVRDQKAPLINREYLNSWDYAIYTKNWKLPFWLCRIPETHMFDGRKWKKRHNLRKINPFAMWESTEGEK
ncbi:MAG: hypothetical protein ACTSSP_03095 [Candidatus Asgardarchaeia archaeon]